MSLKLIVNRVASITEAKKVSHKVISIAAQFLNLKVDYLGFVFEDTAVSTAVRKQLPFMIADPKGQASVCMQHIVSRLENVEYREGKGVAHFIRRLMRRME